MAVRSSTRRRIYPSAWRFDLTESAANTYTEQSVDTGINLESQFVAMVHHVSVQRPALSASDVQHVQFVSNAGQVDVLDLDNPIQLLFQTWHQGAFTDPGGVAHALVNGFDFRIPFPYVGSTITMGIKGESLASALRIRARVWYTLEKVPEAEFLRLLAALNR